MTSFCLASLLLLSASSDNPPYALLAAPTLPRSSPADTFHPICPLQRSSANAGPNPPNLMVPLASTAVPFPLLWNLSAKPDAWTQMGSAPHKLAVLPHPVGSLSCKPGLLKGFPAIGKPTLSYQHACKIHNWPNSQPFPPVRPQQMQPIQWPTPPTTLLEQAQCSQKRRLPEGDTGGGPGSSNQGGHASGCHRMHLT